MYSYIHIFICILFRYTEIVVQRASDPAVAANGNSKYYVRVLTEIYWVYSDMFKWVSDGLFIKKKERPLKRGFGCWDISCGALEIYYLDPMNYDV